MEEALFGTTVMGPFAQLGGMAEVAEETTILTSSACWRPTAWLGRSSQVNAHLGRKGLRSGTIVDASIINAPCSNKNSDGQRDPQMHQTKKGNQWFFGVKAHIGVYDASGLVHHVESTAANVADVTQVH